MAIQSRDPVAILLTRPLPQASRFATELVTRFGDAVAPVIAPLQVSQFLVAEVPTATALILTSETGAQAARKLRETGVPLPATAFCVGDRTACAASDAGFAPISAGGDADALITLILARKPPGPLLHLHGQETRGDVARRLTDAGIPTASAVIYRQEPQPLSPEAAALLARPGPVIVPLFSPRGAALFAAEARGVRAALHLATISPATAQAVAHLQAAARMTAAHPDAPAMLDAIAVMLRDIAAA